MAKEICISSTPHETRLAILEDDQLAEIYYERENEYTLAGSIYKGRVTRVLPGMQSAFVDIGLERDAFLYVTDFLEEQEDSDEYERVSTGQRPQAQQRAQSSQSQPSASQSQSQSPAQRAEAAPGGEAESGDGEDARGARRWRGRRGRRRGVRGRGQQEETSESTGLEAAPGEVEAVEFSAAAEPAASPDAYRAVHREHHEAVAHHHAPAETEEAAHTPFVLPGESLSRYGGKPAGSGSSSEGTESAKPKAEVFAKPSTLVEAPITDWDGGFVLPGESISRRRKGAATAPVESLPESAPEPEVIAAPAAEAVPVAEAVEVPAPAEIAAVAEAPEAQAAVEAIEEATEADAVHEAVEAAAPAATPVEEHLDGIEEVVEEVHEFEPEEGSASHRVDPSAPSEFRISPPESEDFHEETEDEDEDETEEVTEEVTVAAEPEPEVSHEEADAIADATHEAAEAAAAPGETDIYGLAAGAGVFEEEEIDDDEYDFELLHDPAFEEHEADDLEEETLDQGAYLGEVVREAHLEERLGVSDGEEEDAAEEEDDEDEQGFAEVSEDFDEDAAESEEESGEPRAAAPARREGRKFDRRRGRQGGGRQRHGGGGGHRRASVQTMDLPIISDLLKQGQEILVQIAKEPIAKKGARITSHIALPGRFLVFMPTVNHVGVSRKISSDEERQRLKRILISEKGDATGGFIVRTAAEGAGEDELRADIRFLINLWNEIKERSDSGKAPALIYHDLNLVERILRDQVSEEFSTIWVDSETDYERIVRFLNRFQPSLVRRVKLYTKEMPLFEQFGIQDEITKALKSKVWLKSGGSIVINQTEALVAIDINTGKYVGKTARLEDTIVKTNLDAIPEIVRQIRLRDLGGIIVIDFIDMDERKNRHKVLQALEEELKHDRAPSKVLQFNDFGLVAITRKRVKQSLERTLSIPCNICTGTGMVKSPATVANEIYVEMRKMQRHLENKDVLLRVNPEVVKTLKASGGRWLNELEEMTGKTIIVKSDPTLHPEQFDIH
ncbi:MULTISPECIES: Rne/Rng family ribonuclease [Acidobacterium]|uniref:Ribonuclease G n=1 Tax=Acidobacterium capsulatum (strain ATCC 51196 / DSM 11244 / BCRC 80197 / JCM 7670 / NBRC 15755 / NCIMB 13165 / 161) TaxID=240015 RepID=C1F7B7_ACIC5|nr:MULTISPECIES: Rne/Rng family ribonuclease [Acidobacterium]ACO34417.1 ribonuclease, Rne/Rng family, insertion [Acidobacterium capsulatum ATCC 51196]HCT61050.1 ribonuclease [Acidobacterium sp.]